MLNGIPHYLYICMYNWGEPERAPHWSNGVPHDVYIYVYMYRTSFCKRPHVLIHWTASILLSVIQFCKCHHVQIIETASIICTCNGRQRACAPMCTLELLLGQAESANYSYSELSCVSAKLYMIDGALYRARFVLVLGS